jgi:hypothetical protein
MVVAEPRVLEVGAAGGLGRALERLAASYLCGEEMVQHREEHGRQLQELELGEGEASQGGQQWMQEQQQGGGGTRGMQDMQASVAAAVQLAAECPQLLLMEDMLSVKQQLVEALQAAGVTAAGAPDEFSQLSREVEFVTSLEPVLLAVPAAAVVAQLEQLCRGLAADPAFVWKVVLVQPALLGRNWQQLQAVLRVLCGLLKLPYAELKQQLVETAVPTIAGSQRRLLQAGEGQRLSTAEAEEEEHFASVPIAEQGTVLNLLMLRPSELEHRFSRLAEVTAAAGADEKQLRALLRKEPAWLLREPLARVCKFAESDVRKMLNL